MIKLNYQPFPKVCKIIHKSKLISGGVEHFRLNHFHLVHTAKNIIIRAVRIVLSKGKKIIRTVKIVVCLLFLVSIHLNPVGVFFTVD